MATATFAQVKSTQSQLTPAKAQTNTIKSSERPQKSQQGTYELSAEQMTQELGLNKDQSEKLQSIEAEINKKIRSVEKLDPKERNAKEEELAAERSKMVASVLTPEQNKKLEEITAKMLKEQRAMKVQPAK